MALDIRAQEYGHYQSCHATPMDLHMKDFSNLDLSIRRKRYRKICYFLGIMINADGKRIFWMKEKNFRNYTYVSIWSEF